MFRKGEEVFKIAFIALHLVGGQIGMLLVLLTILCSSRIMRQATFVNFCITVFLYSLSYLLLFYTGEARKPNPKFLSCLLQAGMVYGAPPVISISGFMFLLQAFLAVRKAVFEGSLCEFPMYIMATMLIVPYLAYLGMFVAVIIIGIRNPGLINHSTYYCTIKLHIIGHTASRVSAVAMVGVVIMQTMTWLMIHRHWQEFRKIGTLASSSILTLEFIIRALIFTVFCFLSLLVSIAFVIKYMKDAVQNLTIAIVPFFAFLIFGSQNDLLQAWNFWARRPYSSHGQHTNQNTWQPAV